MALAAVSTLAWLPMEVLPYQVTSLSADYGLGTAGAGWTVTVELLVLALTATWLGTTIDRRDKRRLTLIGAAIASVACVAWIPVHHVTALIACCIFVGFGCGMVSAATSALPTLHPKPERMFAYMQVALGLQFGFVNYGMDLAASWGPARVFLVQLVQLIVLGTCALFLPDVKRDAEPEPRRIGTNQQISIPVLAGIASVGLLWASVEAAWTFAEQAAIARGLTEQSLTMWFTFSGFAAPLGGAAAALLSERCGYAFPLTVGFVIQILSNAAMYCVGGYDMFVVGIMLFNALSIFTNAYLMGLLAVLDKTGRGAAIGGASANFGGAVGPLLGVLAISVQNVMPVGIVAIVVLLIGWGLSVGSTRHCRPH